MEENTATVAVVVLCWNGRKLLEEFLPSLLQFNSPYSEVIVADNASTDDSVTFVKTNFPTVRLISFENNYGFAEGYNRVVSQINSELIVLINQDVAVTSGWLDPLVAIMKADSSVAAVQPKILSHTDPSHFEYAGAAGGWIDKYGYTFCRGRIFDSIEEDSNQYNDKTEIFWASGACMLVRKSIYEKLNGLDTHMFAHMEEIDLCWRLKNAGYKIIYCPDSTVYHLGGGSLPQGNPFKTYLNFRNNLIMMSKNLPEGKVFGNIFIRMLLDQVAGIRALVTFHWRDFIAIWKAHFNFILHLPQIKKQRTPGSSFPQMTGVYDGSIVVQYFVRKKKTFMEIVGGRV